MSTTSPVSPTVRPLRPEDVEWIVPLVRANARDALTDEQARTQGFVQGRMDAEHLATRVHGPASLVAELEGRPVGVVLTAAADAYTQGPPARAVEVAREAGLRRIFLYGPALVDAAARGHGVLRALTGEMLRRTAEDFDAAVGFAEEANEASTGAHGRLGWETVGAFTWQDRPYAVIAHPTGG